jgi:hypothetical protein
MFVKPKAGFVVRDPVTKIALPASGAEVSDFDMYWQRRLRDGDIEKATPTADAEAAQAAAPTAAPPVTLAEAKAQATA